MKTVKKIIVTLVMLTTANLMNGAAQGQVNLNRQLLMAVRNNAETPVVRELLDTGANINTADKHGETPLHYAVLRVNIEIANELIGRGANINAADKHGETPLHYAATNGSDDMVRLLLDNGANTDLKDTQKETAMDKATLFRHPFTATILQDWEDFPVVKGVYGEGEGSCS